MKKIFILLLIGFSLWGCTDSSKAVMTYEEMLTCENYKTKIKHGPLQAEFNLDELQNQEKTELLLEEDDCKIYVTASAEDERDYYLYFDFVEYATSEGYKTYSFTEGGTKTPAVAIKVKYKVPGKEVNEEFFAYSMDHENKPNITYRVPLTDDIITQLGSTEDIVIEMLMDLFYLEMGSKY